MPAKLPDDTTLRLPRILCLHGGGTNARIFRAQCRVLSTLLSPHFRLCFAEAPFPSQPGPDVVSVYRHFGDFKSWIPMPPNPSISPTNVAKKILNSLRHTIEEDDRSGADGEWVAVLGFSQGARLAASLLFQEQNGGSGMVGVYGGVNFRFAVLLAGRGPMIPLDMDAMASVSSAVLSLPTIHVHGLQDPGLEHHRELLERYCNRETASLIEWEGNHRVPIKMKDARVVVEEILKIAQKTGCLVPPTIQGGGTSNCGALLLDR